MEQCSPWGQCFLQVPVALWMETCNGEGHPMRNFSWEVSLLSQLAERSSGHGRQRRESNNLSRTEKKQGTETAPTGKHHTRAPTAAKFLQGMALLERVG